MIAIVDYRAGNLTSVARALRFLGFDCRVTRDPGRLEEAERILIPGVGAAGTAMASLREGGLDRALKRAFAARKPLLGICLGCQIVLGRSEENDAPCLDLVAGQVRSFPAGLRGPDGRRLKIPHMGWNTLRLRRRHPVFAGVEEGESFYFVHGYYPQPQDPGCVVAETEHGISFPSAIACGSLVAVQFHPEKSGRPGLRLLANFCRWEPGEETAGGEPC